jgi:hypothetical protein
MSSAVEDEAAFSDMHPDESRCRRTAGDGAGHASPLTCATTTRPKFASS